MEMLSVLDKLMTTFTTTVQQYDNTEDYFIEIPEELCKELGWKEGDTIDWQIDNKGIIITKVKDTSSTKEEPTIADYDWYTVKEEEINNYLESESEGKEFDEIYDDYIEATNEETYGIEGYEFTQD